MQLSRAIYGDLASQVKRDLGLHPIQDTVVDRRKAYELPYPVAWSKEDATATSSPLHIRLKDWLHNLRKPPQSPAQEAPNPEPELPGPENQ